MLALVAYRKKPSGVGNGRVQLRAERQPIFWRQAEYAIEEEVRRLDAMAFHSTTSSSPLWGGFPLFGGSVWFYFASPTAVFTETVTFRS